MTTITLPLGDLYAMKTESVIPSRHIDEPFELFSVPSYSARRPDLVSGADIGSSKVAVLPGDVLLCKIVPHIRRAWVVPPRANVRQIASGEWIVMRDERFHPEYLRHLVLNDSFHARFMSTVAGVGGSLLRARPAHASAIPIRLPNLTEQRRIAAILDQADELRAKRRRALALLDELADSMFENSFPLWEGSPPEGLAQLGEHAVQITDGEHQTPVRSDSGYKLLSARNIQNGYLDFRKVDHVGETEYARISRRCQPQRGDVLVSCSGSVGRVTSVETDEKFVLVRSVALIRPSDDLDPLFLERYLRTPQMQREISQRAHSSAQANLFQAQIRSLPVVVPKKAEQAQFRRDLESVQKVQAGNQRELDRLDELFASLQHRAFRGEL